MKIILVVGATGTQGKQDHRSQLNTFHADRLIKGGSVARQLLQHRDKYLVRCLTRTPNSEKAKALANLGAEIVQGDLTVPPTLPDCLKSVWGVFAVTDFYDSVCFRDQVRQ